MYLLARELKTIETHQKFIIIYSDYEHDIAWTLSIKFIL